MKMRITIIIAIIGSIIIPLFIWWSNQNKPDIRFTLSDPIRIGQGEGGKIWQQMEVRNNGNIEAKDIQVKINNQIESYELSKNSEADKPDIYSSPKMFELRYPVLPPGGLFALTLASTKSRIIITDISILHSSGQGVEAFSKRSLISTLGPVVFLLTMLYYFGSIIYLYFVYRIEHHMQFSPEILLKRRKPFYLNEEKWNQLRKDAIENVFRYSEEYQETSTTKSYRILCEDRPSYLNIDEWNELLKNAREKVVRNIKTRIQDSYDPSKLLLVLKLKRPAYMLESTWMALQKEANDRFLTLKQRELTWAHYEKLPALLNEKIHEGVEVDTWEKYLESVEEKYVANIERELRICEDPIEFLEQQNLSHISEEEVSDLKNEAYYRAIQKLLDIHEPSVAKRFLNGTKPKWMKEADYNKYRSIAQKTLDSEILINKYVEKSDLIDKKEAELSKTINQITAQLSIINNVLNDPETIDRVEEYNNPFAPGNFENLKKVCEFLKKTNIDKNK